MRRSAHGHAYDGHNPVTDHLSHANGTPDYGNAFSAPNGNPDPDLHPKPYIYPLPHASAAIARADRSRPVRRKLVAGRALFQLRLADDGGY